MPIWLPIALMIGSALANQQAVRRVEKERGALAAAESARQAGLGEEARARLAQVLQSQERPAIDQAIAEGTAERERKFEAAVPPDAAEEYIVNPSAPKEVRSEMAREMVDALSRGRQRAAALAKLGGRSDAEFGTKVALTRSGQDLGRIGGFSRGSANVLPVELQGAANKGENWRRLADLFSLGATATGLYGMTQVPIQAAAPVTELSRTSAGWG